MTSCTISKRSDGAFFAVVKENGMLTGFLGYHHIDGWRFIPEEYMNNISCFKTYDEVQIAIECYSGSDYYI